MPKHIYDAYEAWIENNTFVEIDADGTVGDAIPLIRRWVEERKRIGSTGSSAGGTPAPSSKLQST